MTTKINLPGFLKLFIFCFFLTATPAQAKSKYKEVDIINGGSISGTVKFIGPIPQAKTSPVNRHNDVCGNDSRTYDEVQVSKNGELKEAVVYIHKIKQGKTWDEPEGGVYLLEQEKCAFNPKSMVVRNGAKMKIINKDSVNHNIHPFEILNRKNRRITMFNITQPAQSELTRKIKMRPNSSQGMKLECDMHGFMHDWMFIANNPYYSVSNKDGSFLIDNIPPGSYNLKVWHPILGTLKKTVKIKENDMTKNDWIFNLQ